MRRLTTILCLLFIVLAQGQQLAGNYLAYGPEAKYFSNLNYRAYQSAAGYLWFGTVNGLVRFDGKRYKNYFSDYTNPNSPGDNLIFDIAKDKEGQLWFAGFQYGATRYNESTGRFTKYPAPTPDGNPSYGIYQIFSDPQGGLWFGSRGRGLVQYQFSNNSFKKYLPEPDFPGDGSFRDYNIVAAITQDPVQEDVLWVGTFHGLCSFNKTTKLFTWHYSKEITSLTIQSLVFDKSGILWIGTWGKGLLSYNPATSTYQQNYTKGYPHIVYDLTKISDSIIYAACLNSGLYKLNTTSRKFMNITPPGNPANPQNSSPGIQKISVTKDAGIFIGGNYYVYQEHPDFKRLRSNVFYEGTANTRDVTLEHVLWDSSRQTYWIATLAGAGVYQWKAGENVARASILPAPEGTDAQWVKKLCLDAKQRLWALGRSSLLYWDDELDRFKPAAQLVPLPPSAIQKVKNMAATRLGNIWFRTDSLLFFWKVKSNTVAQFPLRWDSEYPYEKKMFNAELLTSEDEAAWLTCSAGLFHCNPATGKVTHIFAGSKHYKALSASGISCASFDKNGKLWLSGGNGLQMLGTAQYELRKNYNIDDGLPSMNINSIATDTAGRIWIGTAAGLGLLDPLKNSWRLFNRFDGLEKDYLDGEMFIANNHLFVDQGNDLLVKNIAEVTPATAATQLRITSIFINGQSLPDSLRQVAVEGLTLPHDQNSITLEFAAMDFLYPFKTSYQHKITEPGMEGSWQTNEDARISLLGLMPGKYKVQIRALNSAGEWSNEILMPIHILAPFWKTAWFISLMFLMAIAILYLLYRYRIKNLLQLQQVRNSISRDLHDEIGATLSSVNMLSAVALKKEKEGAEINPIIEQIKQSVQQAGESIDDIVWSVNPANDSATDTLARIRKYATDLCEAKNIQAVFELNDKGQLRLPMELRRDLYLICKEAINNAMKYADCNTLLVKINIMASCVSVHIQDDGKGFDPAAVALRNRNGIRNMEQRVSRHGGKLNINSTLQNGTTLSCSLNIKP